MLPAELAPRKVFTKEAIEYCMKQFLEGTAGYRSCVRELSGVAPDFTTLYRWLTELGEFAREGGAPEAHSLFVHARDRDDLLAKTLSRRPAAAEMWLNSRSHKTRHASESQKRQEQLEGCERLFQVGALLFTSSILPLSTWDL